LADLKDLGYLGKFEKAQGKLSKIVRSQQGRL
jgi:hypothetical protein